MAKAIMTVTTDFNDLVSDLLIIAEDMPMAIHVAAAAQMDIIKRGMKMNYVTMIPWGRSGDYVYDSIGYNIEIGKNRKSVVGMVGVFKVDHVASSHGRVKGSITAPQIAYWGEYGFVNRGGTDWKGVPWMSNAYHGTQNEQDEIFANELDASIKKRLRR